jgi:hypothetical protein
MLQTLQSQQKETSVIIKQGSWQRRILPYIPLLENLIISWSRHNGAYSIVTKLQVQLKKHVLIPSKGKISLLHNVRPTMKAASVSTDTRGDVLGCKADGA